MWIFMFCREFFLRLFIFWGMIMEFLVGEILVFCFVIMF